MIGEPPLSGEDLVQAVFSDDPLPDLQAAIVVAHPGDETLGASWSIARLHDRASVFCLTNREDGDIDAAVALTGMPRDRCHVLGLREGTLASDLESLAWLVTGAVSELRPRLLIAPAFEGCNLDHDATSFAVRMAAMLMPRCCGATPIVVEFPCHHGGREPVHPTSIARAWSQAIRVDFGPVSWRLKQRMLRCHPEYDAIPPAASRTELYRPCDDRDLAQALHDLEQRAESPVSLPAAEFRAHARATADAFSRAGLIPQRRP